MRKDLPNSFLALIKLTNWLLAGLFIYFFFTYLLPLGRDILAYVPTLFLPFVAAVLLAILLEPLVESCENHFHFSRKTSVIFSLLTSSAIVLGIISLLLYLVIRELGEVYHRFFIDRDVFLEQLTDFLNRVQSFFYGMELPDNFAQALKSSVEANFSGLQQLFMTLLNSLIKVISMLPALIIFFIIAIVASYFMARDRHLIRNFLLELTPVSLRLKTRNLIGELFVVLVGFFKAYTLLILITMLGTLLALKLMGNPYAFSIALLIGFLDIIPILGPGLFFLPWSFYHLLLGNTGMGIIILVVYVLISGFRQLLEPKIIGDNIGLHPLATIMALYMGLKLGGVLGMIMAPVILVVILAMYRTGILQRPSWLK